jgi:hypothetical protein
MDRKGRVRLSMTRQKPLLLRKILHRLGPFEALESCLESTFPAPSQVDFRPEKFMLTVPTTSRRSRGLLGNICVLTLADWPESTYFRFSRGRKAQ